MSPDLPAYRHFFLGNRCSSQCDLVFNTSRNNAVDLSSLGWIAPSSRRPACAMRYNAIKSPVTLPASQEAVREIGCRCIPITFVLFDVHPNLECVRVCRKQASSLKLSKIEQFEK